MICLILKEMLYGHPFFSTSYVALMGVRGLGTLTGAKKQSRRKQRGKSRQIIGLGERLTTGGRG